MGLLTCCGVACKIGARWNCCRWIRRGRWRCTDCTLPPTKLMVEDLIPPQRLGVGDRPDPGQSQQATNGNAPVARRRRAFPCRRRMTPNPSPTPNQRAKPTPRSPSSTQTTNGGPHQRGPRFRVPRSRQPRHGATIPAPPLPSREWISLMFWPFGVIDRSQIICSAPWPVGSDVTPLILQIWSQSTQCTVSSPSSSPSGPVARRSRISTLMTTAYKYDTTN
jgi:hypothetical protein